MTERSGIPLIIEIMIKECSIFFSFLERYSGGFKPKTVRILWFKTKFGRRKNDH